VKKVCKPHLLTLSLTIGLIIFFRNKSNFLLPILHCEDGVNLFSYFYNNHSLEGIVRFYAGYVHFAVHLTGYLACYTPTRFIPYVLSSFSLFLCSLAFSCVILDRFRKIIPGILNRVVFALILTIIPLGNHQLVGTASYQLWNMLLFLIYFSIIPLPENKVLIVLQFIVSCLFIGTHPISIVLVPVAIYNIHSKKRCDF